MARVTRLPQLDCSEWASVSECPEMRLLAAVINQAVNDARSCDPAVHDPAQQFLDSPGLNEVCELLEWDVARLRRIIMYGQWDKRYCQWTKEHMHVSALVLHDAV